MRRLMLALLAAAAHPAAAAERVASIGLCADQAVVALVDPGRIAGLSPQGRDAGLSAVADQARHLPVVAPSAEAVLMSGADLVAANEFGETKTVDMLRRLGVEVIRIPSADSFEAVTAALLNAGTKLGAQARARALADDIAARLRRLRHSRPERTAVAAYYRPDGGSAVYAQATALTLSYWKDAAGHPFHECALKQAGLWQEPEPEPVEEPSSSEPSRQNRTADFASLEEEVAAGQ